ncbi:MAG: hypothetical protein RL549_1310, partial [Verrucomicrobiota bacterium]
VLAESSMKSLKFPILEEPIPGLFYGLG